MVGDLGKCALKRNISTHSSEVLKKIKGGYDFSVKKPTLFLQRQYISDVKRLFNIAQKDCKLKAKTSQQEIRYNYLTEWVSLRKQIAKGNSGSPSPQASPRYCQLHTNKALGCV